MVLWGTKMVLLWHRCEESFEAPLFWRVYNVKHTHGCKTRLNINVTEIRMLLVLWIFLIVRKSKRKLLRWISQHCVKLISTFKSPDQKFLLTEVLLTQNVTDDKQNSSAVTEAAFSDQSSVAEAFHFIAYREIYQKVKIQFAAVKIYSQATTLCDLGTNANTHETDYWIFQL